MAFAHPSSIQTNSFRFGLEAGARLFSTENCLLLHSQIEAAFDNGNLVLRPLLPSERPIRRWKAVITNDDARPQELRRVVFTTLAQLNGQELEFRTMHRPAARFLYHHFVVKLLRRNATSSSTIRTSRMARPVESDQLGQRLEDIFEARAADEVNEAEMERLAREQTFEASARPPDHAEEELARRTLVAGLRRQERSDDAGRGGSNDDSQTEEG
ncbi:MAG: hypothetical protein M1816_002747 [Peltula sp. TS41687]|nr:MAG: hypothetical protein M1816_002747 [Peltula sp. TS41687]